MRHLGNKEIEEYGNNAFSRAKFFQVQMHLEDCADCRRRLDKMYPNFAVAEAALLYDDPVDDAAGSFHLNYEEHLRPFVFGTISAVDREIVESHVESCSDCRSDLRDLLEFHEELEREKEIATLSKRGLWSALSQWLAAGSRRTIWLAASVLFLSVVGLYWILPHRGTDISREQKPSDATVNGGPIQPGADRSDPVPSSNALKDGDFNNKIKHPPESPTDEEITALVLPKFLEQLKPDSNESLRGGDRQTKPITGLAPTGGALRDSAPVLRWNAVAGTSNYDVSVYDADFNRIAGVSNLNATQWRTPKLPKDRLYRWQVTAGTADSGGRDANYLGQGRFYIIGDRAERRLAAARSPLERVKALAEAGLLEEAAAELDRYLRANPDSAAGVLLKRRISAALR